MKKILIVAFFTLTSSWAFGQTTFNISFDRTIDTVQNQTDWAYFNAVLTNPSAIDSVTITTTILSKSVPFGWSIYLCPPTGCLTFIDTITSVTVAPQQTDIFLIKVWTDVMAIGNGDLTVRYENELDSTDLVDTVLYVMYVPAVVGIEENETKTNYLSQNYPNPFSDYTFIDFKLDEPGAILVINNLAGKKIKEYPLTEKEGTIRIMENLQQGIYFYSIYRREKLLQTRKFIVQSIVH